MQKKNDNIMHMSLMKDTDANAAFIFSYFMTEKLASEP